MMSMWSLKTITLVLLFYSSLAHADWKLTVDRMEVGDMKGGIQIYRTPIISAIDITKRHTIQLSCPLTPLPANPPAIYMTLDSSFLTWRKFKEGQKVILIIEQTQITLQVSNQEGTIYLSDDGQAPLDSSTVEMLIKAKTLSLVIPRGPTGFHKLQFHVPNTNEVRSSFFTCVGCRQRWRTKTCGTAPAMVSVP
jgi:hypothetical protein